jgi:hypothetical protein
MKRFSTGSWVVSAAVLVLGVPAAYAHTADENFDSQLRAVRPAVSGLRLLVLERGEALRLTNRTGRTVSVPGYEGEPYLRMRPNGLVEVNLKSPAKYLNEDRFAQTAVPSGATADARPVWRRIGRNGSAEWHDHRIHWMVKTTPPQVHDKELRTKIFDWQVPVVVGQRKLQAVGTLYWDPEDDHSGGGGSNVLLLAGGGGIAAAILTAAAVLVLRRRRRPGGGQEARPQAESW